MIFASPDSIGANNHIEMAGILSSWEWTPSLPRMLHFNSSDKVVELIAWGSSLTDPERQLMLDQAIATDRGSMFLSLTVDQYAKLKA